jgi:hypothetical protein
MSRVLYYLCSFRWGQLTQFLGLLLLTSLTVQAQAPTWQTAMAVGYQVHATTTDVSGNVYVAGEFNATTTIGTTTLVCAGSTDLFVAKWSPITRAFVWAQRAGGVNSEVVSSIALHGNSIYVGGSYNGPTASFGDTTLTAASGGGDEAFLVKLTDAGTTSSFTWAQRVSGTGQERITALAVSGASIYVTGYFNSPTITVGTATLTNSSAYAGRDGFVAKLLDAGRKSSFVWAQQSAGAGNETPTGLAVNGLAIYIAGNIEGAGSSFGNTILASAGTTDGFVAKLTDAGATASFTWAQQFGGLGRDFVTALATNGPNVYVAGYFESYDPRFGSVVLTNAGSVNLFVTKVSDEGVTSRFMWTQQAGGRGQDTANALVVNGNSIYLAGGFYSSTIQFGSLSLTNIRGGGYGNVYVAKLTDAGSSATYNWVQRAGGNFNDQAYALAVQGNSLYVGGYISSTDATFGTTTLPLPAYSISGFLAILGDFPLAVASPAFLSGVTLYPNPTHTRASLQLPPVPGSPHATLTILTSLGQAVRQYTLAVPATGLTHSLDLTGLSAGIYLLRIQAGAISSEHRLAVE